jgi:putative hydrolase of the HAD superfamily
MTGALKDYQDCIRHICQQLGSQWRNDSVELAAGLRFEMNKREVMSPRDGAIEVLSALKANGYKTGLISNCSTETAIVWKNSSLAPLIDVVVLSCLVGLQKPDPRIYQIAMEKLDVRPKECMYIADGLGQELFTALKLRIRAVLIRVPGEDDYEPYREKWDGAVITSLKDVLVLVK